MVDIFLRSGVITEGRGGQLPPGAAGEGDAKQPQKNILYD